MKSNKLGLLAALGLALGACNTSHKNDMQRQPHGNINSQPKKVIKEMPEKEMPEGVYLFLCMDIRSETKKAIGCMPFPFFEIFSDKSSEEVMEPYDMMELFLLGKDNNGRIKEVLKVPDICKKINLEKALKTHPPIIDGAPTEAAAAFECADDVIAYTDENGEIINRGKEINTEEAVKE